MKNWINELNTTNARILVTVGLMAFTVIVVVVGITFRNWQPTDQQVTVLKGVAIFLAVSLGLDVAQFASKRFSDHEYARAKNTGPAQVNVDPPSTVIVEGDNVKTGEPVRADTPEREPLTRSD